MGYSSDPKSLPNDLAGVNHRQPISYVAATIWWIVQLSFISIFEVFIGTFTSTPSPDGVIVMPIPCGDQGFDVY
jgi:hypothetical protein